MMGRILFVAMAVLAVCINANAANGTWTNDASSTWGVASNWLNGVVATGTDATADFSTIALAANRTNLLDSSRTVGNMLFANTNGTSYWQLNPSGGSVLTLATSSGTPTITTATNGANNFVVTINASLAGTGGLTKAGAGVLALGGTNTYSGTTTINGGTLAITNGPGGLQNGPGSLVAYYSFDKVVGNRVLNDGSGGALMDGMLVGNGGVSIGTGMGRFGDNCLNVTQGAVNNNANLGAMGNGGYMLVDNPVIPFTCTSGSPGANWSWALWIKTTTQGAAYMYQGSGSWASGNTSFHLTTGASVAGGGVNAVGVRNGQGWERGTATINDGNWHHIAMTCSAGVKTLYVDGAVDAWQANGWTGAGVGNQLWIGGTGGAVGDGNVQMVGLIDKVVVYNRALTLAEVQMLTNNVVPGIAAPAIPLNSAVSIASGAKLDVNGYFATVTNLNGSGIVDSVLSGGYIAANYGTDTAFNGIITNSGASTLNFYKLGANKLTIAGLLAANNVVVRQGTLTLSGSGLITTNGANNTITVADGTERAVLDIPSGSTVVARNLILGGISASANGGGGAGAVYNRGNYLNYGNTGTGAFALGNSTGGAGQTNNGYGYFLQNSSSPLNVGESGVGGVAGGDGVFEMMSGTASFTNWITIGRCAGTVSGQQQRSLFLIRGGAVYGPNFANEDRWNWSGSGIAFYSVMDIGAGGSLDSLGLAHNINMGNDNNANATSVLTVDNGGFLRVNNINAGAANPNCTVNFNNALVAPMVATTAFLGANLDNVFVYSGSVTISNNLDIGTVVPLKAPAGSGIISIPLSSGGAGYIGRPIVQITDGSGVGATAIAEWDQASGTVTGITITASGSGYSSPTVTLVGGGATTPAVLGTSVLGFPGSGGLTKAGTGTLTLSAGFTYTGNTVIQAGAISVASGVVTPTVAGSLSMSNNTALNLDLSSGSSLAAANLTFQSNVTNNFSYGNVSANPAFAAINASGSIFAPGVNIVLNVNAVGLRPGTFTLIKYTGTPLGGVANFNVTLPPGVTGSLVNNVGNDSIDLTIASAPNQLSWNGVNGNNWNLTTANWSNILAGGITVFQQYTNGGTVAGDGIVFDDTLTNDFVNPQPTNINMASTFFTFPVTVNSTLPYSIAGTGGITGSVQLLKTNSGTLTLLTSNSFTGGVNVGGGELIITNDTALGASAGTLTLNGAMLQVNGGTTNNVRNLNISATGTIGVATNVTARFGGVIAGAGGLTKTDNGTLVLAGSNLITGTLSVNQGTLLTLGTNVLPAVPLIGNSAGLNSVLNVAGGLFQDNNNPAQAFNTSLTIGNVAGAAGDLLVSGGTVTIPKQLTIGPAAYGAFNESSGATTVGGFITCGGNTSGGVLNQSGGTITVANSSVTIGYISTTALGVMNLSGSAAFNVSGIGNGVWPGEIGNGTLNVSGSAVLAVTNDGIALAKGNAAAAGTVNLNGGMVAVNFITNGPGTGLFNFNGGTLRANSSGALARGVMPTAFYDYNGGAVIDDGGFVITLNAPIQMPAGYGIAAIPVAAGSGGGYIDTPIVTISGGSGSNAMATAQVNPVTGLVTNILVTCPGSGYQPSDSLSVSFTGGGAIPTAPTIGTITFAANGVGGLTKKGAGTLTLTATNNITGAVNVNAGTLTIGTATTFSGTTTVSNNAAFTILQNGSATNNMGSLTLSGAASVPGAILGAGLASFNPSQPLINCGTLTINGTNSVNIAGAINVGVLPLIHYSSFAGSGNCTNLILPQGAAGYVSNSVANLTLYVVITNTGPGLVWSGTNSASVLTNVWDVGFTTNWLLGSTFASYHQAVIPGDAVTFNDSGYGIVVVNTNVGPSSLLISNNSVGYTFNGRGTITGSTGLLKLGTGTVVMNLTNNNYAGDTTISNGTLQIGNASALPGAANLNVGGAGTLELAGLSATVNGLFGSGKIDNNSANNAVLTVAAGGAWAGTIQDQGSGGIQLSKTGSATLIIKGTNNLNTTLTPCAQFNLGTTIITNGGAVNCGSTECWIAGNVTQSAACVVDGGTLNVNNYLVIGRNNALANGTLIVNNGTVQKAGGNVIVVGSVGATGTLIVNGGQVLNNSELWLGENATANANLYLNGGLLQALDIRPNGVTPATYAAYFNGGTLQAVGNSANFLQVFCNVMSNGFILDDNGYTLTINSAALQNGDGFGGGFTKKGSGKVYLDTASSYTGTTMVTNGMLSGVGTIAGPVAIASAGTLGAGDAGTLGTLTVNNNLTIQGKAFLRISKTGGTVASDLISGLNNANYGGTLVISNATSDATPLSAGDTFTLFNASAHFGNFASIVGTPGANLAYSFTNGVLSVVSGMASNSTNITFSVSGGTLTLNWPSDHLGWILQAQTNSLSAGLGSNWMDVAGSSTTTSVNITINPASPSVFYRLRMP